MTRIVRTEGSSNARPGRSGGAENSGASWRVRRFVARGTLRFVLVLGLLASAASASAAVTFDNVPGTPAGTVYPGSTFAAEGVVFSSVHAPNTVVPGQTIVLTGIEPRIRIIGNDHSITPPNFAAASGAFNGGPNDVLMTFAGKVASVQLVTDDAVETPNVVRLLALAAAGPNTFVVVKIATRLDDAMTPPGNVLSLDVQGKPVSHVLFQTLNEAEGFDNLTFVKAPDCTGHVRFDPDCFEIPNYAEWIQVGCEIVDCCPGCPGNILRIDWVINVAGEAVERLVLQFADLTREVAAGIRVAGNATWQADTQQLHVHGPGDVYVYGLLAGTSLRWTPASARMTIGEVVATPGTGAARTLRVKVQQQVQGKAISDATLVYSF